MPFHLHKSPQGRLSPEDVDVGSLRGTPLGSTIARQRPGVGGGLLQGQLCRGADERHCRHILRLAVCISFVRRLELLSTPAALAYRYATAPGVRWKRRLRVARACNLL